MTTNESYDPFSAALSALSPAEQDRYKAVGQQMFNSINFAESQILNNPKVPTADITHYIQMGLASGLHPRDLKPSEVKHLNEKVGPKWYEEYGYTEADLPTPASAEVAFDPTLGKAGTGSGAAKSALRKNAFRSRTARLVSGVRQPKKAAGPAPTPAPVAPVHRGPDGFTGEI